VRYGQLTGVALTDEGEGGNAATLTTVDFTGKVWDLVVDDDDGGGIAVGAPIYYHDTGTGTGAVNLNNVATAMDAFFGIALEAVGANATERINVLHIPVGASVAIANDAVDTAQIAAGAVDSETELGDELTGAADGLGLLRVARFTFDPSAVAAQRTVDAHGLGVTLPDNAIVLGGGVEILTTFHSPTTGAGVDKATMALSILGANDLITATAIESGTFWDAVKYKVVVPDGLAAAGVATPIKLTAAKEVTMTVGVDPLDAGKLVGWLFYVIGD
jgi:hypothetical protein